MRQRGVLDREVQRVNGSITGGQGSPDATFTPKTGWCRAVNGISYTLDEGETLGIVGESGCGKSVSALSIMRLIPQPPGKIVGGQILFQGRDLLKLGDDEIRRVRGKEIAMIFQDPMTSLNPVLTISRQLTEAMELHLGMDGTASKKRAIELLDMVGIPRPRAGWTTTLTSSRGHAPEGDDRHGAVV